MLFQVLMILQLCVGLNNVHAFMEEFTSDTKISLELDNVGLTPFCICTSGSCNLGPNMQEYICSAFQRRFEYMGNDNPTFMYCQVDNRTCQQAHEHNPAKVYLKIVYDQFSLVSSSFWMGRESYAPMMESMFRHKDFQHDGLCGLQLRTVKLSIGKYGMPVDFTGEMNYKASELLKFYFCSTSQCLELADKFCADFQYHVKKYKLQVAPYYLGCRVKRFYVADGKPRVDWTMFYDYWGLVNDAVMNTVVKMEFRKEQFGRLLPTKWLKNFHVSRLLPFDFCEISAGAITTRRYYDEFEDPFSLRTRVAAGEHYRILMQQIAAGDNKCPSCFRFPTEIRFSKVGKYARVDMTLFVCGTCFRRQGVNSCEAITEEMERQWKNGSDIVPNDMAPKYEFKLLKGYAWLV